MKINQIMKLCLTGILASSLTACSAGTSSSTASASASALSGTISASGSSALLPLVQAAADDFMSENPDVSITANGGGSGTGLKQVADGSVDIGNSDVYAEEKLDATQASALTDHKVATVVIAAAVNKSLGITNLTTAQLTDIFTGKITNWKEVGGKDLSIMLVTRPSSSGTRALFKKWAMNNTEEAGSSALETDDSGTLMQTITDNEGAIGYVALSYLVNNTSAQAVSIDGVEPTLENTYQGKYNVWGFEHMYTKGEASGVTDSFLQFISGDTFSSKVEAMGYGVASKMSDTAVKSHQ
jgi:phosphate transport system substrate-binding protein